MYNVTKTNENVNANENLKSQKTFNKLKSSDVSNSAQKDNRSGGHNWWANKHDEFSKGEKNEIMQKKMQNKNENVFHGKKKIDFEENVSNSRSYLEEFNVNFLLFFLNF